MKILMDRKLLAYFSGIIFEKLAEVYENQEVDTSNTMKVYESLKQDLIDFKICSIDGSQIAESELMSLYEEMHKIYVKIATAFEQILLVKEYNKNPLSVMWSSEIRPETAYYIARNELDTSFRKLYDICKKIVDEYTIDEVIKVIR